MRAPHLWDLRQVAADHGQLRQPRALITQEPLDLPRQLRPRQVLQRQTPGLARRLKRCTHARPRLGAAQVACRSCGLASGAVMADRVAGVPGIVPCERGKGRDRNR